jgi:SAM-dependent methyltransferase
MKTALGHGGSMNTTESASKKQGILDRQFSHPSGLVGSLAGVAMALEHRRLHRAVVERLCLGSGDRVLEIGFGPGTAIKYAIEKAGFVAGIEPSREMVAQARNRNRLAVKSGRVEILQASAESIPFPNAAFSVVFEVNSFAHWDDPTAGLSEAFRVLRSGGRLLMVLRRGGSVIGPKLQQLTEMLASRGFKQIQFDEHQFGHGGAFVTACK